MRLKRYRPIMVNPRTWQTQEVGGWMAYDEAREAAIRSADVLSWEPAVARDATNDTPGQVKAHDQSYLPEFEYLRSEA